MILSEIAFHLVFEPDEETVIRTVNEFNCTKDEAIKIMYQKQWKDKSFTFDIQTRCICAMYKRLLPKIQTKGVRKINIHCFQKKIDFKPYIVDGIFDVPILFDYATFDNSENQKKKEITLDTVYEVLKDVYKMMEADINQLIEPYEKIKELNYENTWTWRQKISPDRKHSAEVLLHHEVDFIDFYIVFKDRNGIEVAREKILTEVPDEWFYVKHLGDLKWKSNNEAMLINNKAMIVNKNKDKTWSASIS